MKYFLSLFIALQLITPTWAQNAEHAQDDPMAFFYNYVQNDAEYKNILKFKADKIFRLTYRQCEGNLRHSSTTQHILIEPVQRPSYTPFVQENNEDVKDTGKDTQKPATETTSKPTAKTQTTHKKQPPTPPIYGQWIERIMVKGCENTLHVNLLVAAHKNGAPVILPLTNGKTLLDPIDQPFVEAAIATRLTLQDQPCELAPFVIDTNLLGYRSQSGNSIAKQDGGYGWFEKWKVRACDQHFDANVAILPDPQTRYKYIARLKRTK